MESPEGFANAVLQARFNGAKRDINDLKDAVVRARAQQHDSANLTWYWGALFGALRVIFWDLAKRYPNDPYFKPTGRKRPDGSPELQYQKLFDSVLAKEVAAMPASVPRGAVMQSLFRKTKV
jgi:hypothetical protein